MISGDKLKELREKHNIDTKELAFKIKLPRAYIDDVEAGSKKASPRLVERLCDEFDVSVEELIEVEWETELTRFLGDKIRALRESQGMSLKQLSVLTDLSTTYLSEVERMETIPSLIALRRIAAVFNVPLSLFIGNERKTTLVVEKLKKARKIRGLSQKELATKAGLSPGLIGQLETRKVHASLKTLEKLSEALGVSVCSLILEQEEVEEVIGALSSELRDLLYEPKVQSILASICTLEEDKLKLVLNFIAMLNSPEVK